ncbi:SWI/SNF-related matrix-associated actin-dependent regulator of chromatin subfamily A-like protein 1 [Nematocida sp. AWRm78]|nr:SWI/SNF-related matrix-associated actin-dependent regulator of chromatin subfamily A-like protein 1 [Nematocida sp. AWRm78]
MRVEERAIELLNNKVPTKPANLVQDVTFKLALINETELQISPSTKEISAYLCDKPGSNYNLSSNAWRFHISVYTGLISNCLTMKKKVEGPPYTLIKALADSYIKKQMQAPAVNIVSRLESMDGSRVIQLQPHQIEGVQVACERNYRLLIADEMGLGKTLQAISIAKTYLQEHPNETKKGLFIVAPSSNVPMWVSEIKKYITQVCYDVKEWRHVQKSNTSGIVALITSYNGASTYIDEIMPGDFFMGIADESQSLKNNESKRAQALVPFLTKLRSVILLSGTPALSNTYELYTQIGIIYPTLFSYKDYHERYCKISDNHYQAANPKFKHLIKYRGSKNLDELKIAVNELILIRRVKQDCLQLGKKRRIHVTFINDLVKKEMRSNVPINTKTLQNELLLEYNKAAKEKLPDILCFIKQARNKTKEKIIIFAHHKDTLNALYMEFKDRAIKIDGSTARQKREILCDKFRNCPDIDVAVLSLKACSTGLTLVCATMVIFAELPWTPGDLHQAEDRIYRIGQTQTVKIYYLIASHVDKHMWPLLKRKHNTLNGIGITEKDNEQIILETFDPKQKSIWQF